MSKEPTSGADWVAIVTAAILASITMAGFGLFMIVIMITQGMSGRGSFADIIEQMWYLFIPPLFAIGTYVALGSRKAGLGLLLGMIAITSGIFLMVAMTWD